MSIGTGEENKDWVMSLVSPDPALIITRVLVMNAIIIIAVSVKGFTLGGFPGKNRNFKTTRFSWKDLHSFVIRTVRLNLQK